MAQATLDISHVSTQVSHLAAVEQVLRTMRERLYEPLSLDDMADEACLSPYYFNRVFHSVVGIPPGEFLATLRLEAAKRLLLTTSLSVTEICFEVGYSALGSFTTRFTQLVGVPPRHLRYLAQQQYPCISSPLPIKDDESYPSLQGHTLVGRIHTLMPFRGVIRAGLFPKPIPQGNPVRGIKLTEPGPFTIDNIPRGRYFLLVSAMPVSDDRQVYLLPGGQAERLLVGIQGPLVIGEVSRREPVEIVLRPSRSTDPPIITALPYISTMLQPMQTH